MFINYYEDYYYMEKLKPLKFISVTRLLDHLGIATYNKYTKSLKELVANGYDADATRIMIWLDKNKILICDNGTGMNEKEIREGYMMIGSGHKRNIQKTILFKRLPIGNKGIGKLAGFGISRIMNVTTIKDGIKYSFEMDKKEMDKHKNLQDVQISIFKEETSEVSGTSIELIDLLPHIKDILSSKSKLKSTEKRLKEFLSVSLSLSDEFNIFVNNKICTKKDIPHKKKYVIPDDLGKLKIDYINLTTYDKLNKKRIHPIGYIKLAKNTPEQSGVLVKVRGNAVGGQRLFDLNKRSHRFLHEQLLIGEIEVPSFDLEGEEDSIPVIQTDRDGFNEDHPKYIALNNLMTEVLISICKLEEKETQSKRKKEVEFKVKDAIKRVTDVFNNFNKENIKILQGDSDDKTGKLSKYGDEEIWKGSFKGKKKNKKTNPVGVMDNSLKEKLLATSGEGNIRIANKEYKVVASPRGEDDPECLIDDSIKTIWINTSHPSYEVAVVDYKNVDLILFRVIASTWAYKTCVEYSLSVESMYDKIDEMVRFHANKIKSSSYKI